MSAIPDVSARRRALDVERSFIVQAPAGAGKTELLIQRLLSLLAVVERPSQVLAITFTNKAAAEMRERLQAALSDAATNPEPATSPDRERWVLARRVVERDRDLGWALSERFDAVPIETFDALCLRLAQAGWTPDAIDGTAWATLDPDLRGLYLDAARAAIEALDEVEGTADAAATADLLDRMDNRVGLLVTGLADLLARRGQWAEHALDDSEAAVRAQDVLIAQRVERGLEALASTWSERELTQAQAWARVAIAHLEREQEREALLPLAEGALPVACLDDLPKWRALAQLMLTRDGAWRKQVNKSNGFPQSQRAVGNALKAFCLQRQADDETGRAAALLASTQWWPDRAALAGHARARRATQWLLKRALAELQMRLAARGVTDFAGVALAARSALALNMRGVAERLDAQIAHILVDEFQDTNPAQSRLLEQLVAEWTPGDGRTLFLVGDPMQSIYAFRDADVGIFLAAMQHGVGPISLEVLTLSANFRSRPTLVEWVNRVSPPAFAQAAGAETTTAEGAAIPFVAAHAARSDGEDARVGAYLFDTASDEARWIADEIAVLRQRTPGERIAVIVRRRQDALPVIEELARRAIATTAVEFAPLAARPIVRDLLTLTELLVQPTDALALFAWLRSPLVGLRLSSMAGLAADTCEASHALLLVDPARREVALSRLDRSEAERAEDARDTTRLRSALAAYDLALAERELHSLAECVWRLFLRLGGRDLLHEPEDREEAELFLALVDRAAPRGLLADRDALLRELASLRRTLSAGRSAAPVGATETPVEILTIHKAKGLEWDSVFLPALGQAGGRESFQPLVWLIERSSNSLGSPEAARLILATRERRRSEDGSVFGFVRRLRQRLESAERARLLYVAVTRARERLYLSRTEATRASSLALAGLVPWEDAVTMRPGDRANAEEGGASGETAFIAPAASLMRIAGATRTSLEFVPRSERRLHARPASSADAEATQADPGSGASSSRVERALGVVGHRILETLGWQLGDDVPAPRIDAVAVAALLAREGVPSEGAHPLARRLVDHLLRLSRESPHWAFVFGRHHAETGSEVNVVHAGEALRVDRTFITATGERWIVDFKFGEAPPGADVESWLASWTVHHRAQMERYASAFRAMEARPVRCAVYAIWLDRLIPMSWT
jgi:ATP-dependent exoDNAse (exonuclease V) beta subunit